MWESPTKKRRSNPASGSSMSEAEPCWEELTEEERDKVFLVYGGQHFEQSRKRLSKHCVFFEKLFMGKYSDSTSRHLQIEQEEVDLNTFKSFLTIISSEQPFNIVGFSVSVPLRKYEDGNFEELKQLFRLAAYFIADGLLDCLSYIIVSHWFKPKHILEIWLIAENAAYINLQKAAFAMCLDLFESIPKDSLFSLSSISFEMIVKNPNLRCSTAYFKDVIKEWGQKNNVTEETCKAFISKFVNAKINKGDKYLQCVTGFTTLPETGDETTVFVWDNIKLEQLPNISDGIRSFAIVGSQILGRGYSIYVVGGERSIGKGSFNKNVTRYCLLTNKWYKVASLPEPRRHMVAAFLGNNLVLVGGVGMHRIKLSTVQILNIHTGHWCEGSDAPCDFTENPPACVSRNQLLVVLSSIYSYTLQNNQWRQVWPIKDMIVNNIMCCDNQLYLAVRRPTEEISVQVQILDLNGGPTFGGTTVPVCLVIVDSSYNVLSINRRLVWFVLRNVGELEVEVGEFKTRTSYEQSQRKPFKIHEKTRLKPHVGCFNIMNPEDLIKQMNAVAHK